MSTKKPVPPDLTRGRQATTRAMATCCRCSRNSTINSAVFGSGDEVALDFDPTELPPLPEGWVRDYFFAAERLRKRYGLLRLRRRPRRSAAIPQHGRLSLSDRQEISRRSRAPELSSGIQHALHVGKRNKRLRVRLQTIEAGVWFSLRPPRQFSAILRFKICLKEPAVRRVA